MTSSNGNIFRVTGHLCGEFPAQRPVTRSFDVFFGLRLNKRLSEQSWGRWFETLSSPLWRHCYGIPTLIISTPLALMHDIRNEIGSCHSASSCVAGNFGWTSWSSCNRKTQVEQMDTGATAGCSCQLGQQLQLQLCVQNVNKIWCQFANIRACTSVEYGTAQHVINSTGHVI